jgi:3-methyladenine DNA glycosylase AlkC
MENRYITHMDETTLFRDAFNPAVIEYIAEGLRRADASLDVDRFRRMALEGLEDLGYSQRIRNILISLESILPSDDFPRAAEILVAALGPEPQSDRLEGFDGFYVIPMSLYISSHGLSDPETSLNALYEMTRRFSAEFDIRPFLEMHFDRTMAFLQALCDDPSPFARRLASEGTRPRLPLAGRLRRFQDDPRQAISLLDRLYRDENLMVRRSVANHINDISKDNPRLAVETLARWRSEDPGQRTEWLCRHGLRSLIKQEDPGALELLGYEPGRIGLISATESSNRVRIGETLEMSWLLHNQDDAPRRLLLNYVIGFVKANGKVKGKVFRLPEKRIEPGQRLEIIKEHKFLAYKNQRFYPGVHSVELHVNGQAMGRMEFNLEIS